MAEIGKEGFQKITSRKFDPVQIDRTVEWTDSTGGELYYGSSEGYEEKVGNNGGSGTKLIPAGNYVIVKNMWFKDPA